MSSAYCKEVLADYFEDTSEKDWKRIAKKSIDGEPIRTFRNDKIGTTVFSYDDGDAWSYAGDVLYYISEPNPDGVFSLCFNPVAYWEKAQCLWDQHYGFVLRHMYGAPEWLVGDEICENAFLVEGKSREEIEKACQDCGFKTDPAFSAFIAPFMKDYATGR